MTLALKNIISKASTGKSQYWKALQKLYYVRICLLLISDGPKKLKLIPKERSVNILE